MADPDVNSIPELIRGLLQDTRDLIREEIALARAEIREEISAARMVGIAFGSAALAALIGATLLCIAIGGSIAYALTWPAWAGYAIVAVLLLAGAFVLAQYGRGRLAKVRALPKTTETVKENMAWIQSKSSEK
jgi:hypothetical protein